MQALLRLALWQCPSRPLDVAGNLSRLDAAAGRARAAGADLLACPEMFLSGYDIGAAEAARLAQRLDGPNVSALSAIAARHGLGLVCGLPERDDKGRVHNAALLVDTDGRVLVHYRKTHLFGGLDRSMFRAGDRDSPVVRFKGWRLALLICYDVEFPEPARRLARAGADLLVVPTANMLDYDFVAQTLVPARAYENQLYLAYVNYMGEEGGQRYGGLSCLATPDGQDPAVAGRDETLLVVTLDAARLAQARRRQTHLKDTRDDLLPGG